MSVIVNESNISKQLSEFWDLENLGIEAEVSDEENIDNDIMSEFEAGISYQNKRRRATSLFVRLVEGEERWEAHDHPQGVLPQNRGEIELNNFVTCMVRKATANDRRHLAICRDEFCGPV
ncbi:uncharacterized protein TNCV_1541731 [Trichonephila clavipes]|nr:uncharacterized protein TNCV_1541731 [Trichonephila clavipes]